MGTGPLHITVIIVSATLMLDSITLTMVVPIIPDFLLDVDNKLFSSNQELKTGAYLNQSNKLLGPEAYLLSMDSESGRVGMLLSSKALVQLILNPIVGCWTASAGYSMPLFSGTCILLLSLVLFAAGNSYFTLFVARACQGVASASVSVTGLCLVADSHSAEPSRSRAMGFVLGSAALGVLIGYPFGGLMYDFAGKSPPFIVVAILVFSLIVLQFYYLDRDISEKENVERTNWSLLLLDRHILLCGGAIGVSTSAMAILEPCLPIWLMRHIKPKKWQLGTAFIPDSVGYALGTNVFSQLAYRQGRTKVAIAAIILVGLSSIMIPLATSMIQLVIPHFLLGLGIGAVDAALVPMLASLADLRQSSGYGTVYAFQQIAVSLAYAFGPMVGGSLVRAIGFPCLMTGIGLLNICYCLLLTRLEFPSLEQSPLQKESGNGMFYKAVEEGVNYQKFTDEAKE